MRFRRYNLDNQTPRISFPGYGSWDRSWSATARISAPYGYTSSRLDATAGYDVGKNVTLEGGVRRTTIDRTFRETEQTAENTGTIAVVLHAMDNQANVRATYQKASRDYSGLELERSEDATFVVAPTGLSANALQRTGSLRFDQSKRSSDRVGIVADVSPMPSTTLRVHVSAEQGYVQRNDLRPAGRELRHLHWRSLGVAGRAVERHRVLFAREERQLAGQQRHEQLPDHRQLHHQPERRCRYGGIHVGVQARAEKATLNFSGRYQNLKGTAGFGTNPGNTYALARASLGGVKDIPNADNAKITRLDLSVDCALTPKVTLTLGTWYEDYVFSDVDSTGLQNIYPGAFFLALNDGSYNATVGYVRLTYHW